MILEITLLNPTVAWVGIKPPFARTPGADILLLNHGRRQAFPRKLPQIRRARGKIDLDRTPNTVEGN